MANEQEMADAASVTGLPPCRFCGSIDIYIGLDDSGANYDFYVGCIACKCRGPVGHCRSVARDLWRGTEEETEQPVEETEFRIDTNSVNAAVRVTHIATGFVAEGNVYGSQTMNRCYAMGMLQQRLREREAQQPDVCHQGFDEWCASVRDYGHMVQPNSATARQRRLGWDAAMATMREAITQWQAIETIPRDGTTIMLATECNTYFCSYARGEWFIEFGEGKSVERNESGPKLLAWRRKPTLPLNVCDIWRRGRDH